jgi:hypothetical protein
MANVFVYLIYNIGVHNVYSIDFFLHCIDAALFTYHFKEAYCKVLNLPAEISHCCHVQNCKYVTSTLNYWVSIVWNSEY